MRFELRVMSMKLQVVSFQLAESSFAEILYLKRYLK